ncbi:peptidoglycan DD-metalloendopeptidase family protein [Vitreoscilla massiliensis]|uniref:Peptidoglycan DD-metalloendopeptidase family protein n=1 Tax=Vitreoscilla massiliensis TaxID=1689272 RepID=A0ABY4DY72_9NEIS|nr:peptidoglycan DD-metalloendopeptidase family protein [Vitreoscilla massiliensis]UOO88464.1 peptidoglycan DD-metalloendopeptidase family protein [Vitreoscilla massiliensis]
MQQSTLLKTGLLTIAIMTVAACNNFKQPAASVENGTSSGTGQVVTSTIPDNNPYGTGPITDSTNPYTPPVTSTPSTGTYVGNYAPVDINAIYHTVASGDTVYNITKRYGISQDQLRGWNNMADNNVRLGTRLRVKSPDYVASNTSSTTSTYTPPVTTVVTTPPVQTSTTTTTTSTTSSTASTSSSGTRSVGGITWMRPTTGSVITQFNATNKGIDIAGNAGQPVLAAADGKVVYSGSDLRGYGNLIIVQHNTTFLTAYGHNQSLLVKENDTVKRGQTIAYMGNTHTDRNKLHFELRQNGKPVNPLDYIPN